MGTGFAAAASADTGPSARQLRGYAANAITAGARRLGTAYCIDAGSDGNPNTGDQIIVWECNGQAAQEWIWAGDSSGNYYIKYKPDTTASAFTFTMKMAIRSKIGSMGMTLITFTTLTVRPHWPLRRPRQPCLPLRM